MPFYDPSPNNLTAPVTSPEKSYLTIGEEDMTDKPSFGEVVGAAFRQDNILAQSPRVGGQLEPIDVWSQIKDTPYEQHYETFANVRNQRDFDDVQQRIDRETQDKKTMAAAPWYQTLPAYAFANMLDPTVLLPGGAFVRGVGGGVSVLRTAGSVALGAGAQSAAQETVLQQTQLLREASETAINIGTSTLVGGVLGWGGAALLSRGELRAAVAAVDRQLGALGADAEAIVNDLKPKLIAAGRSEKESELAAKVVAANYRSLAERIGDEATALDLYRAEMADVRKGEFDPASMASPEAGRQFFQGPEEPGVGVARSNVHGFEPDLRVVAPEVELPPKPLFTQETNNRNAPAQIARLDDVLGKFPEADASPAEWSRMMAHALGTRDVPVPPYNFLRDINGEGAVDKIKSLTPGQIADTDHGFENARKMRAAYTSGKVSVEQTGKLFLWSFLSRGVSPYTQESLFIDAFNGIGPWIAKAADGKFTDADVAAYRKWASSVAPQGSGVPGAGASHNLNAFGELFLRKMGQRDANGVSNLQRVHNMLSDPNMTGKQLRREFMKFGEGVGIDNKVVSFTALVSGLDDVAVLDRVQISQLWDDGRFGERNLYDGRKVDGKPVQGSALSHITYGARGLLIYEAIERALQKRIVDIYTKAGRPQDASIGRYHWESWVARSGQEASHGTLGAILREVEGHNAAIANTMAKQGEYGSFAYGAKYARNEEGVPFFSYTTPMGGEYNFSVPAFRNFMEDIKKPGSGVVPTGFRVSEAGNAPWTESLKVNWTNLEAAAKRHADQGGRPGDGSLPYRGSFVWGEVADGAGRGAVSGRTGPQVLAQAGEAGPRGRITFGEGKAVIDLFAKADASTFMHEVGHLWLEQLARYADRSESIKADLDTVLKWLGVNKVEDIGKAQHEQWAKAFERYLAEGKAPSHALAEAFENFKKWLTAIYKSLTELGAPLSDDIRGVMDRMLATDAEIAARDMQRGAVANSVGAAAVMAPALADTAIAGRAAGIAARATSRLNPGLRIAHSESAEARNVGFNLFEISQYLRGNQDGMASPQAVETLRKQWDGALANAVRDTKQAYLDYRKRSGGYSLTDRIADLGPNSQRTSFYQEVGRAMRNEDQHSIPEVARAAQTWRKEVFDPLKQAAIDVDLLPADVAVTTAASYFSRMWNKRRLIGEEGRFKDTVSQWVADNLPRWAEAYDRQTERRLDPLRREIADLEMAKLRRGSELKERGDEVDAGDVNEADIRQAIRIVKGGAPKPKGVETLTQFVRSQGGLVEDGGELRHMGINNRSMPGFIRKEKRRIGANNQMNSGGWDVDSMARHAWENGFFPEHTERPSRVEFLEALSDDFNKRRAVVRAADRDAYKLQDLVNRLEDDLARLGVDPVKGARFSTSEEVKGVIKRVYQALDAEADNKIAALKKTLHDRETDARVERDARMFDNPTEAGRAIADEVFNTLTGRTDLADGTRPEFITIKARGPLKERTFNIPDALVERWLESDIDLVGRRYQRIMSSDVELARKFGSPDMKEQLAKVRGDYDRLRAGVTDEKRLLQLNAQETRDIEDLQGVRDLIRGNFAQAAWERNFGAIVRMANATQYILKMGQVVLSSLTEPVRVVAAKGLTPFMRDAFNGLQNLDAVKLSVEEARLAGNMLDRILSARLSTVADLTDFYSSRSVVEKFLDNMTNVASSWNGIRLWTDGVKMLASTMIQNKMLDGIANYAKAGAKDKAYLAFLGIDEGMAGRIAEQFAKHGQDINGVRVAGTANWTDDVARRAYRAALNKDLDSMVVTRGAADLPLFANTPMGKLLFQFNTFNLASHQRVLLRGLQEGHGRFLSGAIALTSMGMLQTYLTGIATNSLNKLPDMNDNPGWWISEGLDKSGMFSVPMQIANGVEKLTGMNPIKAPIKMGDVGKQGSQKLRNRNELGLLGPSAGTLQDIGTVAGISRTLAAGEDVTQAQKNAGERLMPFNSYMGIRQLMKYFVNPPTE